MQLVLPLPAAEAAAAWRPAAAGVLEPRARLTHPVAGLRAGKGRGPPDPFVGVKAAAAELGSPVPRDEAGLARRAAERLPESWLMGVVSKKHPVDTSSSSPPCGPG